MMSAANPTWARYRKILKEWAALLVLILLCLFIGANNPRFFQSQNLIRIATSSTLILLFAIGETFVIMMGSIDLSIEGVVALSAVMVSMVVQNGRNDNDFGWLALVVALATGGTMGLLNGVTHVGLRIPSFMSTLGMNYVGVGAATVLLSGEPIRVLDPNIRGLALNRYLNVPYMVWVALVVLLLAYGIQRYTRLGRYVYGIGAGEDLMKLSGIPIGRNKIMIFTLAGMFYGFAGLVAAAQLGMGNALIVQGKAFPAITAVVVGGTALSGGVGGVLTTLIGVLVVGVLSNGMVLMGISPYIQQAVQGIMIVIAVALSLDRARLKIVK
ncbi:MAG: ABC transporter permease [Chloroflexi bacterium]|nr:ABC transporter permease [Chloroflexota bacterium]